jgi:endonuclease III
VSALSAHELLCGLKTTLKQQGFDYDQAMKEFGNVAASEERAAGKPFALRDHLRGLLLAQLSARKPWKKIGQNLDPIRRIFLDYDPDALEQADPTRLKEDIFAIRCGAIATAEQMRNLATNIATLRRIERDFGSLDNFVTSRKPLDIATKIADHRSPYKLHQVGLPLALEYLKNVGIPAIKPDRHVHRILGAERLGYFSGKPTDHHVAQVAAKLAAEANCNATYFDNLLWLFCAQGYGEVCGAKPKCDICELKSRCQAPALKKANSLE